jgi:hypothetical protein
MGAGARERGQEARQADRREAREGAGSLKGDGTHAARDHTTIRRRTGQAKGEVFALTAKTGKLLEQSIRETRRLAVLARRWARGRGARRS